MADGIIIAYCADALCGVIAAPDGKNYYFPRHEWRSKSTPENGMQVRFDPSLGRAFRVDPARSKAA